MDSIEMIHLTLTAAYHEKTGNVPAASNGIRGASEQDALDRMPSNRMFARVRLREFPLFPKVEEPGLKCHFCRSRHLRLSRVRLLDLPRFLFLQIPVRCRSCHERCYMNMFTAWNLGFAPKAAHRQRQHGK
jgi:hypothetical protein